MTDARRRHSGEQEDDSAQAEICRRIVSVLPHTGVSIVHQDKQLRYLWAHNMPPAWTQMPVTGLTDADFLPGELASRLTVEKKLALESGEPRNLELQIDDGRRTRWFDVHISPQLDETGTAVALTTAIVDATDQKRREQTLSTLLREVSHRSKNLLAIILSIANQTGRYSTSVETFLDRFRGRIHSLAYSQDLVTSSNWRGAALGELVRQQIARYAADPARDVSFDGVDPHLDPGAALHIGLGLHELAVNSLSYGALSRPGGKVEISSRLRPDGWIDLVWREAANAAANPEVGERRFGSVALERVVPSAIGGRARLGIGPEGMEYRLEIPPAQFELGQ